MATEPREPRSWATLHMAEGDPSNRCRGTLVENCIFGPAGRKESDKVANGITFACTGSVVRNNTIVDATDVALGVFGAPGSLIENNVVLANSQDLNGGITMVDYNPFKGNFSGTVVRGNIIDAYGATIRVGLAMGPRVWKCCMSSETLQKTSVFGATVTNNVLKGSYMEYGVAVDGVRNWTVTGNIDEASHPSTHAFGCPGIVTETPLDRGFQMVTASSSGLFQSDFEGVLRKVDDPRSGNCIQRRDHRSCRPPRKPPPRRQFSVS